MTGYFICIVGIDGSGKTTLANRTIKTFSDRLSLKYIYCGWRQFDSFIFRYIVKVLKKFRSTKSLNAYKFTTRIPKTRNKELFKFFVLTDYYITIISRLTVPLIFGTNIISDRYFYDVFINTGLDLKESNNEIMASISKWSHLFPKPDIIFLIDVPVEISYLRKNDIPYKNYLSKHRKLFQDISKSYDVVLLDGTLPLEKLEKLIQDELETFLRCKI